MNVRRFLYLSALLLLPALLFALHVTWNTDTGICIDNVHLIRFVKHFGVFSMLTLFVLIIPIGLCLMHDNRPQWFARWRILGWIAGVMIFSWVYLNAMVAIPYALGIYSIRGPEVVFFVLFGWLYLPIAALPVLSIYAIIQAVRGRISRRVVLWTFAVVSFLYCCLLIWKQYGRKALPPTQTNLITRPIH